ncbi:hypothetical protein V8C86DRAFT_2773812, partial [Haematococcus lacustris]
GPPAQLSRQTCTNPSFHSWTTIHTRSTTCHAGTGHVMLEHDMLLLGCLQENNRSGHVILWDTTASDVSWRLRGVHTGQVSALAWCDAEDPDLSGFFISSGQDG